MRSLQVKSYQHCPLLIITLGVSNGDGICETVSSYDSAVIVQDLTTSWLMDSNNLTLSNISFTVNKV